MVELEAEEDREKGLRRRRWEGNLYNMKTEAREGKKVKGLSWIGIERSKKRHNTVLINDIRRYGWL